MADFARGLREELRARDGFEETLIDGVVLAAVRLKVLRADPRALIIFDNKDWDRAHDRAERTFFRNYDRLTRRHGHAAARTGPSADTPGGRASWRASSPHPEPPQPQPQPHPARAATAQAVAPTTPHAPAPAVATPAPAIDKDKATDRPRPNIDRALFRERQLRRLQADPSSLTKRDTRALDQARAAAVRASPR